MKPYKKYILVKVTYGWKNIVDHICCEFVGIQKDYVIVNIIFKYSNGKSSSPNRIKCSALRERFDSDIVYQSDHLKEINEQLLIDIL